MTDQLSLRLDPSLPRLPTDLRPMLARPAGEPFDSADHLFEPSWGGLRAFAYVEPTDAGPLRLVTADGRDLAATLPETADISARVVARSALLDGELVVVDPSGRADRAALAERIVGRPGPGVAFLAFDLLVVDGRIILQESLERRRRLLRDVLTSGDAVVMVPAIPGAGRAFHTAARAQGIAAVSARVRTSPYLPGVRSRLWRTIPAGDADPARDRVATPGASGASAGGPPTQPVLAVIRRLPFDDGA